MGAEEFGEFVRGDRPAVDAFNEAVRQAQWEHGHGGYTGTIAEKEHFRIIADETLGLSASGVSLPVARQAARALMEECVGRSAGDFPHEVCDKWGPAGAIRVHHDKDVGWYFFGWASS